MGHPVLAAIYEDANIRANLGAVHEMAFGDLNHWLSEGNNSSLENAEVLDKFIDIVAGHRQYEPENSNNELAENLQNLLTAGGNQSLATEYNIDVQQVIDNLGNSEFVTQQAAAAAPAAVASTPETTQAAADARLTRGEANVVNTKNAEFQNILANYGGGNAFKDMIIDSVITTGDQDITNPTMTYENELSRFLVEQKGVSLEDAAAVIDVLRASLNSNHEDRIILSENQIEITDLDGPGNLERAIDTAIQQQQNGR